MTSPPVCSPWWLQTDVPPPPWPAKEGLFAPDAAFSYQHRQGSLHLQNPLSDVMLSM